MILNILKIILLNDIMNSNNQSYASGIKKCDKLLQSRPFITVPFMGAGKTTILNPDVESQLKFGEDTFVPKSIDKLSGISINRFIPLIPCIKDNIQDPKHLVPTEWVRGGADTRAVIRNIDYRKQCLKF